MASEARAARNFGLIRWLTYLMFMMVAMTSDAVGSIIPTVIKEFHLSLTAAGTFHYVPMAAVALGAIAFGAVADKMGRNNKWSRVTFQRRIFGGFRRRQLVRIFCVAAGNIQGLRSQRFQNRRAGPDRRHFHQREPGIRR